MDASPVPMALNDESQNITYLNHSFIQTFGYTREDIPTLSKWWPEAYPDPEYRRWVAETWQTELERAKQTGTAFSPIEITVRCKDGTNKTVIATAASLADRFEGEHLVQLCDITASKEAQESLRASQEQLTLIFRTVAEGLVVRNAKGEIITCNSEAERILGLKANELIERNHVDPPLICENGDLFLENAHPANVTLRTGKPCRDIVMGIRKHDGQILWISVNTAPLFDSQGNVSMVVSSFGDITSRKRLDEELRTSRQRLETLSRLLITTQETERRHLSRELHDEIGQVLTAIKMSLRRTHRVADAGLQLLLEENVEMVDHAIGQVRNLALSLRPAQLDELGLVAALHWLVKHQADLGGFENQLEIEIGSVQIAPDLQTICFRIVQEALTNIIRHARSSNVHVKLWVQDDMIHLSVHDDGIGFDVNEFHRRTLKGSNLGLVSMQERASLVGGSVRIESELGRGTRIDGCFPLAQS